MLESEMRALLEQREATIGIVGLGYVGLPIAHAFSVAGNAVIGFDVDQRKVDALAIGERYLDHLAESMFADLLANPAFDATTDMSRLGECDVILVAVPTPLGDHQEPDLGYVQQTARDIGRAARPGQVIVLESTTFPGTTRDVFLPDLLASSPADLVVGEDIFIAFSPEREDPGRDMETSAVPKLVGGLDEASGRLASQVYRLAFADVVQVDSAEIAEAAKLLENIFRAVNIALVNEMKSVLQAIDIDVWKVVEAAATKPYGFMKFTPGPGLGGHCIPIDPFYMTWRAKEAGQNVQFIELAGLINHRMPDYVIDRLAEGLNRCGLAVSQSRVLVMGLAYKPGIGDSRESPSYELIRLLQDRGASVDFHDDFAPVTVEGRKTNLGLRSVSLDPASIESYDVVLISTAHPDVDWEMLASHAKLIVDTRNAMAPFAEQLGDRLILA